MAASETETLTQRVIEVIRKSRELERTDLSAATTFEELGFDSLDGFDLFFALEEELDIAIPDEAVRDLHTIGDVVERLRPLIGGAST